MQTGCPVSLATVRAESVALVKATYVDISRPPFIQRRCVYLYGQKTYHKKIFKLDLTITLKKDDLSSLTADDQGRRNKGRGH